MIAKNDTIAAIATANGHAGIGVVRISGNKAGDIACQILKAPPKPRHAHYVDFKDEHNQLIDKGLLLFFPSPHSYTGEDVLELQGHGGPAVLQLVLRVCLKGGARLAEPGEFTFRAFLNDKLDLAQAEAVADLIEATTVQAARSALRSLNGDFSQIVDSLLEKLIRLRMLVEAMLDFPEEETGEIEIAQRLDLLIAVQEIVGHTLKTALQGSLLREGARIAIIGRPNVGKSSLLNLLSGEQIALVSQIPGTTRDVISKEIQIQGVPLHIMDTAGLRQTKDVVEQMGIELAHKTAKSADLILVLHDATDFSQNEYDELLSQLPENIPRVHVYNKADLLEPQTPPDNHDQALWVSAKTGQGIEELKSELLSLVGWNSSENGAFMARERHLIALRNTQSRLIDAGEHIGMPELFAEDLRQAQLELGSITGKFSADDLLGKIFSQFCIGK